MWKCYRRTGYPSSRIPRFRLPQSGGDRSPTKQPAVGKSPQTIERMEPSHLLRGLRTQVVQIGPDQGGILRLDNPVVVFVVGTAAGEGQPADRFPKEAYQVISATQPRTTLNSTVAPGGERCDQPGRAAQERRQLAGRGSGVWVDQASGERLSGKQLCSPKGSPFTRPFFNRLGTFWPNPEGRNRNQRVRKRRPVRMIPSRSSIERV